MAVDQVTGIPIWAAVIIGSIALAQAFVSLPEFLDPDHQSAHHA